MCVLKIRYKGMIQGWLWFQLTLNNFMLSHELVHTNGTKKEKSLYVRKWMLWITKSLLTLLSARAHVWSSPTISVSTSSLTFKISSGTVATWEEIHVNRQSIHVILVCDDNYDPSNSTDWTQYDIKIFFFSPRTKKSANQPKSGLGNR